MAPYLLGNETSSQNHIGSLKLKNSSDKRYFLKPIVGLSFGELDYLMPAEQIILIEKIEKF